MSILQNVSIALLMAAGADAGPAEFGRCELNRAASQRGLPAASVAMENQLGVGKPECFNVSGKTISAGDERGLMYG